MASEALRTYRDGDVFYYRGNPLTLGCFQPSHGGGHLRPQIDGGEILIDVTEPQERAKKLQWWYTSETWDILRGLLPGWCKKIGVRPAATSVKHVKTRWGSCSSRGTLLFNARLSMLSADVAEYVVVHELCHLIQMNHSQAFWQEVGQAIPAYKSLRAQLRQEEKNAIL